MTRTFFSNLTNSPNSYKVDELEGHLGHRYMEKFKSIYQSFVEAFWLHLQAPSNFWTS
jgi:hypothetical protein